MTIKEIIIVVLASLLIGWGGCVLLNHNKKVDKGIVSTTLAPNQKEKIVLNPQNHTITVVTKNGTKTTYLPNRPVSVTEDVKGNLSIQERTWGWEKAPYAGIGYSNGLRIHAGVDLFYFHRFDTGIGLLTDGKNFNTTAADLNLSYNFYSNTSMAVSYSSAKVVGCFLKFRF